MTGAAALGCAVLAAVGYGSGSVLQSVGARRATGVLRIVGNPLYLAGLAVDLLAWALSVLALRVLPVYEVQSILAGSLGVTAVVAWLWLRVPLSLRATVAIVVTMLALTVLVVAGGPQLSESAASTGHLWLVGAAVVVLLLGRLSTRRRAPGWAAATAGAAFGGAALSARVLTVPPVPGHHVAQFLVTVVTDPAAWSLIAFGVAGTLLYARALHDGTVGPVTAVLWIVEVIVPSIVGVAVLGDTIRAGWLPQAVVAVVCVTAAAVTLAVSARPVE